MTSMTNISNNNDGSECCFDKNEFYAENGLAKVYKKDRKSHSKNAANQMEERHKKIATQISQLPKKMRAKLAEQVAITTSPGKTKNTHVTKLFHNRNHMGQSATQEVLCDEYDEDLLAIKDAYKEADENKTMRHSPALNEGLLLWLSHGLTKEKYDANRVYQDDLAKLDAYYEDPDHSNHPQYGLDLEADIKKYEDAFDESMQKDAENKDNNDWWMADHVDLKEEELEFYQTWREIQHENEMDDWRQETETYEDWCENKREQDMEDCRQNAIDDDRDD
jgi:hypothetical protein